MAMVFWGEYSLQLLAPRGRRSPNTLALIYNLLDIILSVLI